LLGIVLCTGVDGSVVALTHHGSLAWQVNTNSPIFAGACISSALSSQVGILMAVSQRLDPWNPFHVAAKDIFFVYNIVSLCVQWYI
jgi:hypothetical protein